jgi:enterochelin esterase-like enzyme
LTSPAPIPSATHTTIAIRTPSPETTPSPESLSTPTRAACLERGGRIETGQARNRLLKLPLEFRVYLPPCYDQQGEQTYPVLYLIHGQNYNDDQWDRLGVDETLDALVAAGELPPFIVVMPRDRSWTQPDEDLFGRAVMETLLPHIDQTYRTLSERRYRAIGGLSRGAGWAIHLGLSNWESFGTIGAHSLPVFWTDLPHLRGWLEAIPREALPRLYLDLGDKDRPQISKSARWFEVLLTEKDIPHEWHLYPGYHEEAYWEAHLEEYLRWYAADWQDRP